MIENHNLREENRRLEEKLNSVEREFLKLVLCTNFHIVENTNKTDSELRRIQTLLTIMDLEPGEPDDNNNQLHEVPSVSTALNRLKEHHEDNCEIMTSQIQSMKRQAQSRAGEIERLKSTIHEMTAPGR